MAKKKLRTTVLVFLKRTTKFLALVLVLYVLILLIGLIPVNNDFESTENGITVHLTSNAVHADIIVPITTSVIDWRTEFPGETLSGSTESATHVAFGWGDQGFFIETPTWNDLKLSTAANALLVPSDSCLRVVFTRAEFYLTNSCSIKISENQYKRLVEFIELTFETDARGQRVQIPDEAYSYNDAFFRAKGNYHALNTCNSWVGRALKKTGVRVPLLTTMPKTPMLYLPATDEF